MIYISKLCSPISTGTSAGDIDVGATVKINENGQPVDYLVVHQGLPGDMYDASCEGTWFLRKDIAENRQWHSSNMNDYANSTVHAYLNGDWLNRYDPDVAEAIVQCKIPYVSGNGESGSVVSGANGLSVKSFLLGGYEAGFTNSLGQDIPVDGIKLDYFDSGIGTTAKSKRIAYINNTKTSWWSRSSVMGNSRNVEIVYSDGSRSVWEATSSLGLRPTIILPYSFKFKEVS